MTLKAARKPRDSQRKRVYDAEREWREVSKAEGWTQRFPTRWEVEEFVTKVHRWCVAKRGRVPHFRVDAPTVRVRKNAKQSPKRSFAYPEQWRIRLGTLENVPLLHELAHLYAPPQERHGPGFAATFLVLVTEFMGVPAATSLREHMLRHGVRLKPKRKVNLTPERRRQLSERMAAVRAARSA